VAARRRLVVQARHPSANRRQGLARHRHRQHGALGGRQPQVQAGVVAGEQATQPSTILCWTTFATQVAAGAPQREGQVVDAGPLPHEVKVGQQHRPPVTEQHVVVPEVTVDKLPWQPGDQPSLGLDAEFGELLGHGSQVALGRRGSPALDPLGPTAHGRGDLGRLQVVGEPRPASLLPDLRMLQQVVGLGQQRHPGLQALPGVHDRVMVDVGLHLHQPALEADPRRTLQGRHRRGAWHAPSQQRSSGLVDGAQPLRGDVGPVDPHHIPAVGVAHQQVQA